MNLQLTTEQQMLQEAAGRLFAAESTPQRVRACETQGFDAELWKQVVELGFATMRVPEDDAPAGMGLFEALLVAEAAGTHLASVPLAEALVAARLLGQLDGTVAEQWLDHVRNGALVVMTPTEWQADTTQVVPGGGVAQAALMLRGQQVLLLAPACLQTRPGMGMAALATVHMPADGSLPAGAVVLAEGVQARNHFLAGVEEWKLLTAAALAGLSRQALLMAASYASERKQFDRAIGSFQGIAHPLADALTEIDGAQLLVWRAVWALAHKPAEAAASISQAWWWAAQSAPRATARALHTFGGYGVSLEYDIQLYYRRARAWSLPLGDTQTELERLANRLWSPQALPLPEPGEVTLAFGVGAEAEAFGLEVRRFFEAKLTPELKAHAHHSVAGYDKGFAQQLARAGLLYPHWPVEFGGRGKNPFDMAALGEVFEEFGWERITAPVTNQVAQIVMRFGRPEVKQEALTRFASGDALACLGFSEPSSGCDVFAARTRAVKDGDHWVINGQKIFTTAGNLAQYIFLLVRTNPDVPKHRGLSLFLVPMDQPGITLQPVHTLQDERTNITYLDNVRVPERYLIGEVDGGLNVMAATLELEHGGDQYRLNYRNMLRHALAWAQNTQRDGLPMLERPDVRTRLAAVAARTAVAEVLCHRTIWGVHNKVPGRAAWGPMSKVFSTEMYWRDANELMDLAAPDSLFEHDPYAGEIEVGYRQSIGTTIYGGTSEIQRSLIAEQGLGLPRSRS